MDSELYTFSLIVYDKSLNAVVSVAESPERYATHRECIEEATTRCARLRGWVGGHAAYADLDYRFETKAVKP